MEKTELHLAENNVGLLVVDDKEYQIYNSIELLSKAYTVARKIHPEMTSIAVCQGDVYKLLLDGVVNIHDVKINFKG